MSTHASISIKLQNTLKPVYRSIYCHFDGYPSATGKNLVENFNTYDKVLELIELGDVSCVGKTLEAPETVSYWRDKNESRQFTQPKEYDSVEELVKDDERYYDYFYVFEDGVWNLVNERTYELKPL